MSDWKSFFTHTESDKITVEASLDDKEQEYVAHTITFESLLLKDMRGHPITYTMIIDWNSPKQIVDLAIEIIEKDLEC